MNITIQELLAHETEKIKTARALFLNYFNHLYQHIPETTLGIASTTHMYLNSIFDTTEAALACNAKLFAAFAYSNDTIVGFAVFGPLERAETILIRTLPIALAHEDKELDIRTSFVRYVYKKFPQTETVIIMVRKANTVHNNLCISGGFFLDASIFEQSPYIQKTYNAAHYNGYVHQGKPTQRII